MPKEIFEVVRERFHLSDRTQYIVQGHWPKDAVESIKKYPEGTELLEDVIIENKQAIEMANIYSGILSSMMGTFASVISNNLNIVMKVLAVITIVMSIPTIVFSAYGMNLSAAGMPFSRTPWGFLIVIILSVVASIIAAIFLSRKKFF